MRVRSVTAAGAEDLSGFVLWAEGVGTLGRIRLRGRYGQGRVTAGGSGSAAPRSLTEGDLAIEVQAWPWLDLWTGPRARSYVTSGAGGDTRWSYWEAGASLRGTLVPGQLRSYGEAWMALRGRISVAAVFDSERGAEGGVIARVARDNLWARFGYRIEQTRFTSGRRETVEAIRFSVGWDLR